MFKKLISLLIIVCISSLFFVPVFASNEPCTPIFSSKETTEELKEQIKALQEQIVHLQEALQMYGNTTARYIPIRLVAESLGYDVVWNTDKTIDIFTIGGIYKDPEHICRFSPGEYVISENRSYIPAASILRLCDEESYISFIGDEGYCIYRDWFSLSESKDVVLEQSFERILDNDSCLVELYSNGNKEHPGGPPTIRIKVVVQSRTF